MKWFIILMVGRVLVAQDALFTLGEPTIVKNPGVPIYPWYPDGHISFLQDGDHHQMYWVGDITYRTLGQDVISMQKPVIAVLGKGEKGSFDNGGAWLMSVFRKNENELIGFYHAEDREFDADPTSQFISWKSIALCTSVDNGVSWTKQGQIISSSIPKPNVPTWGGNGDHCVVWDSVRSRWVCFYQEHYLMLAVSESANAEPGSWFKYYNGEFTEEGWGGKNSPIPSLMTVPGGNPSVHYNTALDRWVMIWHSWEGQSSYSKSLWLSTSEDLMNWTPPQPVLVAEEIEKYWYPTIIGESDVLAGQDAWLYYAYWPDFNNWQRQFIRRSIHFEKSVGIQAEGTDAIDGYGLEQNYPNPFNACTHIAFQLSKHEEVKLSVWNMRGEKVAELVNETLPAGRHSATFDASALASGIYCLSMTTGTFAETKKMLLIK